MPVDAFYTRGNAAKKMVKAKDPFPVRYTSNGPYLTEDEGRLVRVINCLRAFDSPVRQGELHDLIEARGMEMTPGQLSDCLAELQRAKVVVPTNVGTGGLIRYEWSVLPNFLELMQKGG